MPWSRPFERSRNSSPIDDAGLAAELVQRVRQRGLLVRRLVLVDHAFAGGFVQLAAGGNQQLGGLVLFAGLGGLAERAHSGAKRRLHRLVAQSGALVGAVALLLRLDVGHAYFLLNYQRLVLSRVCRKRTDA